MAAFPNDDHHEPVEHYVDRDSEESGSRHVFSFRVDRSMDGGDGDCHFTEVDWELTEIRRHHAKLEAQREQEKKSREARRAFHARKPSPTSPSSPWRNTAAALFGGESPSRKAAGLWQRDREMEQMRKGARPPMLGRDIKFPRCSSPEPARFDVTQGSQALRNAMCYLTEQSKEAEAEPEGLWKDKKPNNKKSTGGASLWSAANSRSASGHGLWQGYCVDGGLPVPKVPTGIMTPRLEGEYPLEPREAQIMHQLPPSPPPSNSGIGSLDEKLEAEHAIELEFDDAFVTQVYNYLSLGYPAMARRFDEELSKITRIPVSELRQDDNLATARGYIRLGDDEVAHEEGITEETCVRWKALRSYIREWARQQPRMAQPSNPHEGWGVAPRRGSWSW